MGPALELPQTIRFADREEIPNDPAVLKRWAESGSANIVQGYTFRLNENNSENELIGFNFYSEINIDNSNLWNLIMALSETLPDVAAVLFGPIDSELHDGNYGEKKRYWNLSVSIKKKSHRMLSSVSD